MGTSDVLFSVGDVQIEGRPPPIDGVSLNARAITRSLPSKGTIRPCLEWGSRLQSTYRDHPRVPSDRVVDPSAGFIKDVVCLWYAAISSTVSLLSPIPFFFTVLHRDLGVTHFPVSVAGRRKGRALLYAAIFSTLPFLFLMFYPPSLSLPFFLSQRFITSSLFPFFHCPLEAAVKHACCCTPPFHPISPFRLSIPIHRFCFVFISIFRPFLIPRFTMRYPDCVSWRSLEIPVDKLRLCGLSRVLRHPVSFRSTLSCTPTCIVFSTCDPELQIVLHPSM